MSKKLCLLFLITLGIICTFVISKNLTSDQTPTKHHTFRQILQAPSDPLDKPFSLPPAKNTTGNIPSVFFTPKAPKPTKLNTTCAKFPDLFDLQFRNDHWQLQKTSTGSLFLFNAYFDRRGGDFVRIITMFTQHPPETQFWCQFWYQNSTKPVIVESEAPFWLFSRKWGADRGQFVHPYLIKCPVKGAPFGVSLVEKPYKSLRLVEWIELLQILGVEKINFYEFRVHPNTKRLLDYYEDRGLVEVTPISLLENFSNNPPLQSLFLHKKVIERRLQEVIPYNDCLYKHLDEFKFVVLLDTDEVIIPVEETWLQLIQTLEENQPNRSSYMARNVYFLDNNLHQHEWFKDVPQHMHMLQHVIRARNYTKPGHFVKGFHDTRKVEALHNHFPLKCLKGCDHVSINVSLAHLQHYRTGCARGVSSKTCDQMRDDTVMDTRIWNFKQELIRRVDRVSTNLGLL
nr:PREDICTED: uncharacterized protein LOC659180 [Tribolium castaneum]|eukprot:XP_015836268.1 PREDICTED: uncharacterized protein LOC659180 [Tribolium castaneum]